VKRIRESDLAWSESLEAMPAEGQTVWAEWVGCSGRDVCLMLWASGYWSLWTDRGAVFALPSPKRWAPCADADERIASLTGTGEGS
jgi:hypothetical protein